MTREPRDPDQIPAGPEQIGEYRIEGELGKGGMGIVYKAYQEKLDRHVALKVLPPSRNISEEAVEKFIQEAKASASLHHPNIAPIYDIGADGDIHYFAMEYVDGRKFDEIIKDTKVPLAGKLQVLRQVARALQYAHGHGLVHRDVKPGNIMIDRHGRVLLMDFGLARPEQALGKPEEDSEIGTPGYMAPEQALGKTVDRRSDVFSLGAILYDVLAVHKSPARIDHANPSPIEAVALMAMQHDPGKRYQSADGLQQDIRRYLRDEPVLARPVPLAQRLLKSIKKHRALVISIAITVLVAGAFSAYFVSQKLVERARWRLVFEDDFERGDLGPDWYPYDKIYISNNDTARARLIWRIENGQLVCDHPSHTFIRICRKFTGDLRMEFDAVMTDSTTDGIHCFMLADTMVDEIIRGRGYAFAYGARGNTVTYLSRLDQKLARAQGVAPRQDIWYHIIAERRRNRVSLSINGKTVLKAKDTFPITSLDHTVTGLHSWQGITRYDNVRVYRTTLPLKASPLAFADDLVSRGKYEEAISYYQDIMGSFPEKRTPPEVFYKTGNAYLLMKRYDLARVQFDKAITWGEDGQFACKGYIGKGHAYLQEGNRAMARTVFNEAVAQFGEDPQISQIPILYREMASAITRRSVKQALTYLHDGLKYCEQQVTADLKQELQSDIAMLYHRQGSGAKALASLEELLKVRPDQPTLLARIGELYAEVHGNTERQISFLSQALRYERSRRSLYKLYRDRARAYLKQGEHPAALSDINRAVGLFPTDAWGYKTRADIKSAMGDSAAARQDLDTALIHATSLVVKNPENIHMLRARGNLCLEMGLYKMAIENYNVILAREPEYMWTRKDRSAAYLALGRREEAMADLHKIIPWCRARLENEADNVWYLMLLTRSLLAVGEYREARETARKAASLSVNNYAVRTEARQLIREIEAAQK